MTIKYALYPNKLTPKDDFVARVKTNGSYDEEGLRAFMLQEAGGTTLTAEAITAVSQLRARCLRRLLQEGHSVSTDTAHYSLAIRGVFNSLTDSFDAGRHEMVVNINPRAGMKEAVRALPTEAQDGTVTRPRLYRYDDARSDTADSLLSPGGGGHLLGRDIEVDPDDVETGIFLIAADGTETAVTELQASSGRHAYFVVPATLTAGSYTLVVRGRFGTRLIEGELQASLTVA